MSHTELMQTEATVGRWLGREPAVLFIVLIAFWIGGKA